MSERKIIQFQHVLATEYSPSYLIALCDDGSLWELSNNGVWSKIPEVVPND